MKQSTLPSLWLNPGVPPWNNDDCNDDGRVPPCTQEDIFSVLGVDLVQNAWRGYNAALFAYGQTGAGKSHSMTGPRSDPGILPRACDLLFHFIEHKPGDVSNAARGDGRDE